MQLLSKIDEIINSSYKESGLLLSEDNVTECQPIRIDKTGVIRIYKFDKAIAGIKQLFPFYNDGRARSMCDFIIFYPKEDVLFVFICNLKSKQLTNSRDQVFAGHIFSKFIVQTAARCCNEQDYLSENKIAFRALIFSQKIFSKSVTNSKKLKYQTDNSRLPYQYLKCGEPCDLDALCH
jgi:hypothetical protein